jgi:CheY-like chemotaxis protein/tRNA A-37 threonylcarbamoyl transferase component Bud32
MDVTAANIGLPREQFLANVAASKLVPELDLQRITTAHDTADAITLASTFVKEGLLSDYQLDAINNGQQAELKMGNYDVIDRLGAGGMGVVYKARHRRMKRVVALKVLSAHLVTDRSFVQRFQREVETIAKLGHPNIVMAYDADEAECGHFLVMEFVNGRDLTSLVEKQHPVPVPVAVDCIMQAARGLAFAHAQGIIHRDIKPGNLLRDLAGVVKVTDLGLARQAVDDHVDNSITQAGGVLGTVDYMAPEQAVDSTTIDHRADIYSLGATLYFLLTGQPPYTGKTVMAVLLKHREGKLPSLRDVRNDVSVELDAVFHKMMAKTVERRFQTMGEVAVAMEAILNGAKPKAPMATPTSEPTAMKGPVSVVIVEPSRVQASIVRKYLEPQGIIVPAVAGTAADAITAIKQFRPTAVVTTMHLSDQSGVDVVKQLRAELGDAKPGFVLISTEADAESTSLSQLDHVVLLTKPFTPEQLMQSLSVVTGRSIVVKEQVARLDQTFAGPRVKADRSKLRVLVVDDSRSARVNERQILNSLGFTNIIEADDGAQGLVAATNEPVDLIVTDYNMPLMDGYAMVSYLKQSDKTAKIPIIMVTTETAAAILDPVRKLGVVAIFEKAFPAASVGPVLDRLFG